MTNKTQRIVQNSMLLALLIIFTYIKFPLGAISFTMQLFIVFLIGIISTAMEGMLIIGIYIVLGLIGLPIFSMGGGLGYIYQPSFGFMLGFLLVCPIVKLIGKSLIRHQINPYISYFIASLVGLIADYIVGILYAYFIFNLHLHKDFSFIKVMSLVVAPFVLFDIVKCILAAFIGQKINKIISIQNKK